ncbi:hypothetical protein OAL67_00145 [bacterium]|nr:hypothetical protein [bacterium]
MKTPKLRKHIEAWKIGLLQAAGIAIYILAISSFMSLMSKMFVRRTPQPIVMGVIMLLIFSISALVCGLIVFTHPVKLAVKKQLRESIVVVIWTSVFLVGLIALVISGLYLFTKERDFNSRSVQPRTNYDPMYEERTLNPKIGGDGGSNVAPVTEGKVQIEPQTYPYEIDINTGEKTLIKQ